MRGVKACLRVVALAWTVGPGAAILSGGEVLGAILRFAQPLVLAWLVDSVLTRDVAGSMAAAALFVLSLAASAGFETLAITARVRLIDLIGKRFDQEFLATVAQIRSLDSLEAKPVAAAIRRTEDRADAMGYVYNSLVSVVIYAAAPVTSIAVAFIVDPRLVLLVVASVPVVLLARTANRRTGQAEDLADVSVERIKKWAPLFKSSNAAIERSVYRLWPWYRSNIVSLVRSRERELAKAGRFEAGAGLLGEAVFLVALAGLLGWLVFWPSDGFSTGMTVAAFAVGLDLRGALGALRFALGGLGPGVRSAIALQDLFEVTRDAVEGRGEVERVGGPGCGGLSVGPVTYTYPNGTVALNEIELNIPSGSVVSVVGENGSGKTTLMEVILGLRKPGASKYVEGFTKAAMPQSFGRPEFQLEQAISMGRDNSNALKRLGQVAPRDFWTSRGGAAMQLGGTWEGGSDLSGGEWQVVGGARALLERSDLLVLDEPTAALDPAAREHVTRSLLASARSCADDGGIAIIVTHSMAIPHRTDYIVHIIDGKVGESGTHKQLIDSNGAYARMYALATSAFDS